MAGTREQGIKNLRGGSVRPERPNWKYGWCSYKKSREVPPASRYILKQAEALKEALLAREVGAAQGGEINPVRAILIDSLVDVWTLRRLGMWQLLKKDAGTQLDLFQRVLDAAKTEVKHSQALGLERGSRRQMETLESVLAQIAAESAQDAPDAVPGPEDDASGTDDGEHTNSDDSARATHGQDG